MYVFKLKNVLIFFIILLFCASIIILYSSQSKVETMAKSYNNIIVVDAGHGLPDGGATANGIMESDLNLKIAQELEYELIELGYDVIMTRKDENNIGDSDKQNSISEMKKSDLNNRVKLINECGADIGISIHLNKYSSEKYWGWQTFYNEFSDESKKLANCIQDGIGNCVNRNNKRQALKIDNVKIVNKTNIPVVIVECGFISNVEEASLLKNEDYQEQLVQGICEGIQKFYE